MTTFLTMLLASEVGAVVDENVGAAGADSVWRQLPDVGKDDVACLVTSAILEVAPVT